MRQKCFYRTPFLVMIYIYTSQKKPIAGFLLSGVRFLRDERWQKNMFLTRQACTYVLLVNLERPACSESTISSVGHYSVLL